MAKVSYSNISSTTSTNSISESSTGGKIVKQGADQWYGENDNGVGVAILDGGKDDINMYRYGSRQIYEVHYYGAAGRDTDYVSTKADAMSFAKEWLRNNK